MQSTKQQQLALAEQPRELSLNEPDFFFGDANFIAAFKLAGQWRVKWFRNLDDDEYDAAIRESNIWRHFQVKRGPGIAEVHYDSSAGVDPDYFENHPEVEIEKEDHPYVGRSAKDKKTLVKVFQGEHVDAMTDIELVTLVDDLRIKRDNLLNFLKTDFKQNGHTNWSKKELERIYGKEAILHWLGLGFIVRTGEGVIKLAHVQPGTAAHALMKTHLNRETIDKLLMYDDVFDVLK